MSLMPPPDLATESDSGASDTDNLTKITTPTFTGTSVSDVTVYLMEGEDSLGSTESGGSPWTITVDLAPGVHNISYRFGPDSESSSELEVTIDVEAPTAAIDLGPDTLTGQTTAVFDFSADEDSVTYRLVLDGGDSLQGDDPHTFTGLGDGAHTLLVTATDLAGNEQETPTEYTWSVDLTGPEVSAPDLDFASDSGTSDADDLTNATTPTFTGTGEEGAAIVLMEGAELLGEATVSGGTWTITSDVLEAGPHVLYARAFDQFGNSADSEPLTITVDTTAPETSISTDISADTPTADTTAVFDFGSDEDGVTYQAELDGGGYSAVDDPLTLGGLGDGTHTLLVYAGDAAGNEDATPAEFVWTVDTTPPDVSVPDLDFASDSGISDTDDLTSYTTPVLVGTGEEGALVRLFEDTTLLGETSVSAGGWTITSSLLGEGSHAIFARAIDAAGNSADSEPLTITVDTTAPETSISTDTSADTPTADTTAVFDFGSDEDGVTYQAELDGGGYSAVADPLTLTGLDNGTHTLLAYAVDAAGNEDTTPAEFTWTVDTTPPEVSAPDLDPASDSGTSDADDLTNDTTPTFAGTGAENAVVDLMEGDTVLGTTTVVGGVWTITSETLGEGSHAVFARGTDLVGNTFDSEPLTFTIDATAPEASIVSGPDSITAQTTAVFDFGPDEGGITFTAKLDSGSYAAVADPLTLTGLGDGPHTLLAYATDAAGNADTTPAEYVWTVDTVAPAVSAPDLAAASDSGTSSADDLTNDTTPTFVGTGEEDAVVDLMEGDTVLGTATVAGGTWTITSSALGEDTHAIHARATDAVGNSVDSLALTVTIDTTAPDASIDSGPDSVTAETTAVFDFGPSEDGITFTARLDAGSYGAVTDPLTLTGLSSGPHTLSYYATDAAGNADTAAADQFVWSIDSTPPAVSAPDLAAASDSGASSTDDLTNDTTPTFTGTGEESAVVDLMEGDTVLGTATVSGGTWTITSDALDEGTHAVYARATDAHDLSADSAALTITIDTTAPDTTIPPGPAALTSQTTAVFDFGPSESGITFTAKLDDGSYAAVADPLTLTGLADGPHTLLAYATDAAGNADTTPAEYTWAIDTTPPDTTVSSSVSGLVMVTSAQFDFTSDDGTASFEAKLDGASFAASADPLTLTGLADGVHTLLVRAVDAAGNRDASPGAVVWTVDAAPPDTTILSGPSGTTGQSTAVFDFGSNEGGVHYEAAIDGASYTAVGDPATLSGLAEGAHTLLVRAVDAAGNVDATPSVRTWTIDLTAPPAPTVDGVADDTGETGDGVTTDRTLRVAGTAAAGTTVHVLRDGVAVDTVLAGGNGTWSWNDPSTLAYGHHDYAAFATDGSGNASATSPAFEVQVIDTKASAGSGGDVIAGGSGSGSIDGKDGNDTLFGEAGNDTLKGGNGDDVLSGGGDSDALWGGNGNDSMAGGKGQDTLWGEGGDDTLAGGDGNDRIEGGAGDDSADGGGGDDTIYGGAGVDTIVGGSGADRIFGDAMGDWIVLGADGAKDTVSGGVAQLSDDTILGFETGKGGDVISVGGLPSSSGKYLDSLAITDGVLSLSKVGGGVVLLDGLTGTLHTDTMLASDGGILLYVV